MCMKTSLIGKLFLLISMAVQGIFVRRLFSKIHISITFPEDSPSHDRPTIPHYPTASANNYDDPNLSLREYVDSIQSSSRKASSLSTLAIATTGTKSNNAGDGDGDGDDKEEEEEEEEASSEEAEAETTTDTETTTTQTEKKTTISAAAAAATTTTGTDPNTTGDTLLQMDIMVPVYERDDRLRVFAKNFGKAVADYLEEVTVINPQNPRISRLRLLVTRFSLEEQQQADDFKAELADITNLPLDDILMVMSPKETKFSRSRALNMLHEAACHLETCLISRLDVDMEVRKEFFQHSVEIVYSQIPPPEDKFNKEFLEQSATDTSNMPVAYFPIVWSAYNPDSVVLVENKFRLEFRRKGVKAVDLPARMEKRMPEFSHHRGHWRPYGKGMYVIRGSDATALEYDTKFVGWGGEDVDFYNRVVALPRQIHRRIETGLIHQWHPKLCDRGKYAIGAHQIRNCKASVMKEEGSDLGRQLLYAQKQLLKRQQEAEAAAAEATDTASAANVETTELNFEDLMNVALPVATVKRALVLDDDAALGGPEANEEEKVVEEDDSKAKKKKTVLNIIKEEEEDNNYEDQQEEEEEENDDNDEDQEEEEEDNDEDQEEEEEESESDDEDGAEPTESVWRKRNLRRR